MCVHAQTHTEMCYYFILNNLGWTRKCNFILNKLNVHKHTESIPHKEIQCNVYPKYILNRGNHVPPFPPICTTQNFSTNSIYMIILPNDIS